MFTVIYFETGSNRINIHRNLSGLEASKLFYSLSKQTVDQKTVYQDSHELLHVDYRSKG